MKFIQGISSVLLCTLIVGCGFQLRGNVDLPKGVEPIYLSSLGQTSLLALELKNLLGAYGVELSASTEDANYQLQILKQEQDRRTASLGEGARAAEYQLIETVEFELRNASGKVVLGPNKLTERRIMPNDPNRVASTGEEEKLLRREMLQNLAAKIARQLRSFDYNSVPRTDNR